MASPFSEPTKLVQIFGSYKSQVKSGMSLPGPSGRVVEKRPLSTRLTFDESFTEDVNKSKVPKLNRDPFDSIAGRKRFGGVDNESLAQLEEENHKLREKVKALAAENAGELAKNTRLENRLKNGELNLGKERLEWEHKIEKATRLYKVELDKNADLAHKLKKAKERQVDKEDRAAESRRLSLDRSDALELKVRSLKEAKDKLENKVEKLEAKLGVRADIDAFAYRNQVQKYESEISSLKFRVQELEEKKRRLSAKVEEQAPNVAAYNQTQEELTRAVNKVEEQQCELETLRDAAVQKKIMQEKLDRFGQIERENASLKSRNCLLLQTQDNIGLLKEQVANLTCERDRMEKKARDRDSLRADVEVLRSEAKQWVDLLAGVATADQRRRLAATGIQAATEILQGFQARELELVNEGSSSSHQVNHLNQVIKNQADKYQTLEDDLKKVRGEQAEQARLIKKLQRKLLLVTKERDSNKAILDSVEKEMTLSGNQWEQEKIIALEKTLEEYKAMANMLMEREEGDEVPAIQLPCQDEAKNLEQQQQMQQLQIAHDQLQEKYERLEMELESRAIKGDFNPDTTKVLHFKQNPMSQAVESMETDVQKLQSENDALKARIKLLEEGQTKDLTMMVGHRMEEGASSVEVQELQLKLESADKKNQRIMEAFKKTSKEFREVIAQAFGFKVDVRGSNYKFTPCSLGERDKFIMFEYSPQEGVQLLGSEYMNELDQLYQQHLLQNDSIPMFMSALTSQIFFHQHPQRSEEETLFQPSQEVGQPQEDALHDPQAEVMDEDGGEEEVEDDGEEEEEEEDRDGFQDRQDLEGRIEIGEEDSRGAIESECILVDDDDD